MAGRLEPSTGSPSARWARWTTRATIRRWSRAARWCPSTTRAPGRALTVASPFWLEGVAKVAPRFPPGLGEHSSEILREIGYGEAEIDRLVAARVIVQGKSAA